MLRGMHSIPLDKRPLLDKRIGETWADVPPNFLRTLAIAGLLPEEAQAALNGPDHATRHARYLAWLRAEFPLEPWGDELDWDMLDQELVTAALTGVDCTEEISMVEVDVEMD